MKLIYCKKCGSVLSLDYKKKNCDCGNSWGRYEKDGINAEYGGDALPIGFTNYSFNEAIKNQPFNGLGYNFSAFVIPSECDTFIKRD